MQVFYKETAVKQVKRIPKTEVKKILRKLDNLGKNPYAGKPLKGELKGFYSLKSWPFRVIYRIEKKNVIIYSVAHRQGVYKS